MIPRAKLCGDKTGASGGNMRSLTLDGNLEQMLIRYLKEAWDCSKLGVRGVVTIHPTVCKMKAKSILSGD